MTRRELIEQLQTSGPPDDVVVVGTRQTAWDVEALIPARAYGHGQGEAQSVALLILGRDPVTVERGA